MNIGLLIRHRAHEIWCGISVWQVITHDFVVNTLWYVRQCYLAGTIYVKPPVVYGQALDTTFRMLIYPMLNKRNANPMTPDPGLWLVESNVDSYAYLWRPPFVQGHVTPSDQNVVNPGAIWPIDRLTNLESPSVAFWRLERTCDVVKYTCYTTVSRIQST